MPREKKAQIMDKLQEILSTCSIGIFADYRGLSAPEMTELRRRLRELGIEYKVIKNTLARFAAERAGKNELVSFFNGPTSIAFSYGDITEPARVLADYIRTSKEAMYIKGGFLSDRLLTAKDVMILSTLPSREVLLAKVVGGMQAPILILLSRLAAPMGGFINVLQARIKQLEGSKPSEN
jgi:large subunit ribosomal protein L10